MLLLMRLENKVYSKIATLLMLLGFLAVFHWVSFGAGERNGTVSTPFSVTHGVSVRTPFAIFTILLDVLLVAGWLHSLLSGRFVTENKLKVPLVAGLIFLLVLVGIFFAFNKKAEPRRPSTETPFVSTPIDDAFWLKLDRRRSDKYRKQLKAAPPVLVVRETHYADNPKNGIGTHYGWIDGRVRTWASPFPNSWRTPTARITRTRNFPRSGLMATGPIAMM
jgi:cbb3-type cytochrome oxidase subunit 3